MSKLEVDKIDPQSGTALEIGSSGDTITIPTGATLDASNATTSLPATVVTTTGTQTLTNKSIAATQLTGTITPSDNTVSLAKLSATGTKDATTFLRGDNTFAVPTDNGKVLQVVSTTKTDTFSASIAGGAFTDVTGLTVSITPSSTSNKILVLSTLYGSSGDSNIYGSTGFRIFRDAVGLHPANVSNRKGTSGTVLQGMTFNTGISNVNFNYLDTPSSTSSLTYKVQVMNTSSGTTSANVNRSGGDPDSVNSARTYSTITLMEIAG